MQQPSTSRPKLTRRNFNNSSNQIRSAHDNNNDDFPQNRGFKRKNSEEISVGGKRQFTETLHTGASSTNDNRGGNKFSANARLMQYRKVLENKQNEVVKVHTLQKAQDSVVVRENQRSHQAQRFKGVAEEGFREKTPPVSRQKSSINRRLNISTRDDCRQKTHTPSFHRTNSTSSSETAASPQNSFVKVSPQKTTINQRLKDDYKHNSHTFSFARINSVSSDENEERSRNFVTAAATSRQNSSGKVSPQNTSLNPRFKADYKHNSHTFSFARINENKESNRQNTFVKVSPQETAINQRLNSSCKEDCGQKSPFTPKTPVLSDDNENCSRNFVTDNCVQSNVNARLKTYKESALAVEETSNNSVFGNEDVEMDWSPITEEQIITDINNIRQNVSEILNHKSSFQETISAEIPKNDFVFKDTFIVVDTNIFISHLDLVQHLLSVNLNGVDRPFILIPWVVIQELDYMKDGRDGRQVLQLSARKAVNFINENLLRKDTTLKGQGVIDATKHSIPCNNLDDGIVACCLQVIERGNRAILLSNDKNLRNKSLISAIPAYSSKEIFQKLGVTPPSKHNSTMQSLPKSDHIKRQLTTLFNTIIHSEALNVYGEYYHSMGIFKKAPWSLEDCLKKFENLWITMFSEKLPKQFLQNVENLRKFLNSRRCIRTEDEHERFVKLGLNICLFLKNGLRDYFQLTVECIDRIINLA